MTTHSAFKKQVRALAQRETLTYSQALKKLQGKAKIEGFLQDALAVAVEELAQGRSLVISGGTLSGKTRLLQALLDSSPAVAYSEPGQLKGPKVRFWEEEAKTPQTPLLILDEVRTPAMVEFVEKAQAVTTTAFGLHAVQAKHAGYRLENLLASKAGLFQSQLHLSRADESFTFTLLRA